MLSRSRTITERVPCIKIDLNFLKGLEELFKGNTKKTKSYYKFISKGYLGSEDIKRFNSYSEIENNKFWQRDITSIRIEIEHNDAQEVSLNLSLGWGFGETYATYTLSSSNETAINDAKIKLKELFKSHKPFYSYIFFYPPVRFFIGVGLSSFMSANILIKLISKFPEYKLVPPKTLTFAISLLLLFIIAIAIYYAYPWIDLSLNKNDYEIRVKIRKGVSVILLGVITAFIYVLLS